MLGCRDELRGIFLVALMMFSGVQLVSGEENPHIYLDSARASGILLNDSGEQYVPERQFVTKQFLIVLGSALALSFAVLVAYYIWVIK